MGHRHGRGPVLRHQGPRGDGVRGAGGPARPGRAGRAVLAGVRRGGQGHGRGRQHGRRHRHGGAGPLAHRGTPLRRSGAGPGGGAGRPRLGGGAGPAADPVGAGQPGRVPRPDLGEPGGRAAAPGHRVRSADRRRGRRRAGAGGLGAPRVAADVPGPDRPGGGLPDLDVPARRGAPPHRRADVPGAARRRRDRQHPGLVPVRGARRCGRRGCPAVARLYGALADPDRSPVPAAALDRATRTHAEGFDAVNDRPLRFGLGYELADPIGTFGPEPVAFGHSGAGGGRHGAWPERGIGFSFLTNEMRAEDTDDRASALLGALHACL
ncbi:putative esterase [Pseudonocardia sp. Ae168_Ps1]|nr:putative esterase [Pseudonocardia sp. Ae150A_Ps1]OLL77819.1 putative esterase [Pseudonocardia sp. Ae168_Ps1]OLL88057.1 putative esterase [Pseudonocardia sp. Ae263_Ps1]OLL91917.1 putative esterase [Pseudonocardia sp. Ae356_Ps1]